MAQLQNWNKKVICIRHISKTHDPEPTVSEAKGSNINNPRVSGRIERYLG